MKIAITGGIGCGKSTFLQMLTEFIDSDKILSADEVVADLYQQNEIQDHILALMQSYDASIQEFSKDNIKKIFHIPEFKTQLEAYVHPKVREAIQKHEAIFVEVPLLYESDSAKYYDQVWVIFAPNDVAKERIMKRNGFTEEEAQSWIDKQMPIEDKIRKADHVFYNQNKTSLKYQISKQLRELNLL